MQMMTILWHADKPLSSKEIGALSPDIRPNKVLAVIRKLLKRDFIESVSVGVSGDTIVREYGPVLTEGEYMTALAADVEAQLRSGDFLGTSDSLEDLAAVSAVIKEQQQAKIDGQDKDKDLDKDKDKDKRWGTHRRKDKKITWLWK